MNVPSMLHKFTVLLAALLQLAGSEICGGNIELKLLTDKTTYMIHEPIWIDILVMNCGSDTVNVPRADPQFDRFKFIVVQNGDDTLRYLGDVTSTLGPPPSHDLAPLDTLYGLFNLLRAYKYSKPVTHFSEVPLQGEISVSAYFHPGPVVSNKLDLTIDPISQEERGAYELLTEHGWPVRPSAESSERLIDTLTDLLSRYPGSVYAPTACRILEGIYGVILGDPEKRTEYLQRMLEAYPNSGYVVGSIPVYLGDSRGAEREARLDSLMTKDKPFRLRMIARNWKLGIPIY